MNKKAQFARSLRYVANGSMPQKTTIKGMQVLAAQRGGQCLSKRYVNSYKDLRWQCVAGHRWASPSAAIKTGRWCQQCLRGTIEDMQAVAAERGGKCVSKRYVNSRAKLRWQCAVGHTWEATGASVKYGRWCPKCMGMGWTIKDMQALAKKRGGKCLSKKYVSSRTKLRWQCAQGHAWPATSASVRTGRWCPKCAGQKPGRRSLLHLRS